MLCEPATRRRKGAGVGTMVALLFVALTAAPPVAIAGGDWNDDGVAWKPYAQALEDAAASGKPICLVFYTDWCPHCTKYSGVFHDPKVIDKAKSFVMVRLNKDENKELSSRYAPDGEYIPRTYFLRAGGEINHELRAPRDKYQYFYNPQDPRELLAAMDKALAK